MLSAMGHAAIPNKQHDKAVSQCRRLLVKTVILSAGRSNITKRPESKSLDSVSAYGYHEIQSERDYSPRDPFVAVSWIMV